MNFTHVNANTNTTVRIMNKEVYTLTQLSIINHSLYAIRRKKYQHNKDRNYHTDPDTLIFGKSIVDSGNLQ